MFGILPLLGFMVFGEFDQIAEASDKEFILSMVLTGVALFALGAIKERLSGGSMIKGGIIMLLCGGAATVIAFFVGWALERATAN